MLKKSLEIHSENILPIIKKWLYSDKDIFIRELVSNACDALQKVKLLRDKGEAQVQDEELRIDIAIDKEARTLKFMDTGIGMDAEEVQKYIAQIAFSGAEEFMQKYKSESEQDAFIGHFGLGFYSAYMVASKVEIDTLSYKPNAQPVFWSCDGSTEYELDIGTRQERGTTITLYLEADHAEFLDANHLGKLLEHYCGFLPYPIYLGSRLINPREPLWIKNPSECSTNDYLEFYRHLYPNEEDPLFWLHLNVDYPFHLKGILYFPKITREFDINKNSVKLFCNRVFVADNCKDVIPNYLMVLRGVIDSPDIPLNVSRSYLQMDRTVRQLAGHISKKVADSLMTLYHNEKERFIQCWNDVSPVVKLGAIEDDKFYDRVKECLIWKTTEENWMTAEDYLERNRDKVPDKIFYTADAKHAAPFLELYRQKEIDVLCAGASIDSYLIHRLESKLAPAKFQRIDAGVDDLLLDKNREKTILDSMGKTEATHLADLVRSKLGHAKIEVEAKSLASDALPAFVMINEEQRRLRDYLLTLGKENGAHLAGLGKQTLVINTNSPLINALPKLNAIDPELTSDIVQETYELALLAQREIDATTLNAFISRSNRVLEKLMQQVTLSTSSGES